MIIRQSARKPKKPKTAASDEAMAARYDLIKHNKVLYERAFDPELVEAVQPVKHHLVALKWENMVASPCAANISWVREFFAIVGVYEDTCVTIRGTTFDWLGEQINKVLGLSTPFICHFSQLLLGGKTLSLDEIATVLRKPVILAGIPEAAIWFQYVRHNLIPTVHDSTVSQDRCWLLYCILKEQPIDARPIAHAAIKGAALRTSSRLIFPALITKVKTAVKVPVYDSDELVLVKSPIGMNTMDRRRRAISGRTNNVQVPPTLRTEAPQAPRTIQSTAAATPGLSAPPKTFWPSTGYGNEVWLTMLSGQIEDISMKLGALLQLMTTFDNRLTAHERKSDAVWAYQRYWNRVLRQFLRDENVMYAANLP